MRHLLKKCLLVCVFACLGPAGTAHAQVIWNGGVERGFRPGTSIPFDGEPFSHKYGYGTGSFIYPFSGSMNGQRANYLDYADRVERAYKFGYPPPPDPWCSPPPPPSRTRVGIGLGYYRLR